MYFLAARNLSKTKTLQPALLRYLTSQNFRIKKNNYSEWSYQHGISDKPLLGITIGKLLDAVAEKTPDKEAFIDCVSNTRVTFSQLREQADKLGAGLFELGLKKGDRVGVWGPNSIEWIIAQYGTARAGLILVSVNPAYKVNELEYCLKKVDCKAILSATEFKGTNYYDMLKKVNPELDTCASSELVSKKLPNLKTVVMFGDKKEAGTLSYSELMNVAGSDKINEIKDMQNSLQFDDPINIQYTSGTTGSPKAATLSHQNIINNAYLSGLRIGYDKKPPRICLPVPLYHCFGMVCGSLAVVTHSATVVLPSRGFDAEASLRAIENEKCTTVYGTPTMFIDMINHDEFDRYDKTSLCNGIMAGSPCPIEVARKVATVMHVPDFQIAYGQTETSPISFMTRLTDPLEHRTDSIGYVMPHTEAKVIDSENCILPSGQPGELCIRGYLNMLYYWNDPEKTKEALKDTRWLHTGDLAIINEEGRGFIVGRIKDVVIRGGENIYPTEIEQFLYTNEKIQDVQVIGVPDTRMGEELCACIRVIHGETISEDEVKEFCKGKIAHYKVPRYVVQVDKFPLTVSGKVKKFELRESIIKNLDL